MQVHELLPDSCDEISPSDLCITLVFPWATSLILHKPDPEQSIHDLLWYEPFEITALRVVGSWISLPSNMHVTNFLNLNAHEDTWWRGGDGVEGRSPFFFLVGVNDVLAGLTLGTKKNTAICRIITPNASWKPFRKLAVLLCDPMDWSVAAAAAPRLYEHRLILLHWPIKPRSSLLRPCPPHSSPTHLAWKTVLILSIQEPVTTHFPLNFTCTYPSGLRWCSFLELQHIVILVKINGNLAKPGQLFGLCVGLRLNDYALNLDLRSGYHGKLTLEHVCFGRQLLESPG